MIYKNLSEQLLLTKCGEGDTAAFRELYQQYRSFVFGVVYARLKSKEDARDVTQGIFIDLWTGREQLPRIRDFKVYLYVLSRNQVISAYRKNNIRINGESYLFEQLGQLDYSAEDHKLASELNSQINQFVKQLPDTMQSCYSLSKNEGKKNGEIADMLNISEKTVRNNVSEALKRLKLNLQHSHPELLTVFVILVSWLGL